MMSKKSKAVGPVDEAALEAVLRAIEVMAAKASDVDRQREIGELLSVLGDHTTVRFGDLGSTTLADYNRVQPPRARLLDSFLEAVNSVMTFMPDPIPPRHPWAQDLAALRGDLVNTGRDAWVVIARQENERRRQEG